MPGRATCATATARTFAAWPNCLTPCHTHIALALRRSCSQTRPRACSRRRTEGFRCGQCRETRHCDADDRRDNGRARAKAREYRLDAISSRFPSSASFVRLQQSCASASQRVRTSCKLDCWAMLRNAAYKRPYSSECIIALRRSGRENGDGPACGKQVGPSEHRGGHSPCNA